MKLAGASHPQLMSWSVGQPTGGGVRLIREERHPTPSEGGPPLGSQRRHLVHRDRRYRAKLGRRLVQRAQLDPTEAKAYQTLWSRFRNEASADDSAVGALAKAVGLDVKAITRRSIGRFVKFDAVLVHTERIVVALPVLVPERALPESHIAARRTGRELWRSCGWFHPPYVRNGLVHPLINELRGTPVEKREGRLSERICDLYDPADIASMLVTRYPQIPDFADHLDAIRDAAEVFSLGYPRAAIGLIVPVVEGVLAQFSTRLTGKTPSVSGSELFRQAIDAEIQRAAEHLVYHGMWVPAAYKNRGFLEASDEYIYMLSVFQDFGVEHLFARSDGFQSPYQLNRPGILHGKFTAYAAPSNFYRLWGILDMLAFALSFNMTDVSILAPELDDAARKFTCRLRALQRIGSRLIRPGEEAPPSA